MIRKKIFNIKFFVKIVLTVAFSFLLRLFYLHILHLNLVLDSLDITNLSFLAFVALFRNILSIILDELLLNNTHVVECNMKNTTLLMEGNSSNIGGNLPESSSELSNKASKKLLELDDILLEMKLYKDRFNIGLAVQNRGLDIRKPLGMSEGTFIKVEARILDLDSKYNECLSAYINICIRGINTNDPYFSDRQKGLYEKVMERRREIIR